MSELAPLLPLYLGFCFIIFVMFRNYKKVYIYLKAINNKNPNVIRERKWGEKYADWMSDATDSMLQAAVFLWFSIIILLIISVNNPSAKSTFFKAASSLYFAFVFLSSNLFGCWAVRRHLDSNPVQEASFEQSEVNDEILKSIYFKWTVSVLALFSFIWVYISFFKK